MQQNTNLTAYISKTIGTIEIKFTVDMPLITPIWSNRFSRGPWRTDYFIMKKMAKNGLFFLLKVSHSEGGLVEPAVIPPSYI